MKQPSDRQLKAIAIRAANPTMSKKDAALQAGYPLSTARNATQNIFGRPLVQTWLEQYQYTIEKAGLTKKKVARKLNELLEASTPVITIAGPLIDKETGKPVMRPNHKLQLETIKVYNEIFGVTKQEPSSPDKLKRKITLEEYEEKEL